MDISSCYFFLFFEIKKCIFAKNNLIFFCLFQKKVLSLQHKS